MHHPNLVQFIDYFEDVDYNYLVMEMMTGGELFTRIVEKVRAVRWFACACAAAWFGMRMSHWLVCLMLMHAVVGCH